MSPEELQQHRIEIVEAKQAADQAEVDVITEALNYIGEDPYKYIISDYYFENKSIDEIMKDLAISENTVLRNKNRLVRTIACRLYGIRAVE